LPSPPDAKHYQEMHLFLSHATPSKPRVRQIVQALPAHVTSWLDQDELVAGHRFANHIEDAIAQHCDYLVVFVCEQALASDWVQREVAMGLRREVDLKRTFVIPLLLEPALAPRLAELEGLGDRLYLAVTEPGEAGHRAAGQRLADELFALSSRVLEGLRELGRRGLIDRFQADFTAWQQAAYQWRASLGNPIEVLLANQQAFDHVRESVAAYNRVSDAFIPQLALHRDRLTAAWAPYRGLCEDVRDVTSRIEAAYRGDLFQLNRIHEMVHAADTRAASGSPPDAASTAAHAAEQRLLLEMAGRTLSDLTERVARVVAGLGRELG
jgi:hypothetical protein